MPSALDSPVTGGNPNPVGSLTASARPLPEDADWQAHGVSHDPEACQRAWVWQRCSDVVPDGDPEEGDVVSKPLNGGIEPVTFLPFLIEANAACEGISRNRGVLDDRAKRTLQLNASQQIGRAFSSALPDGYANVNPNLTNSATDITGAGPSSLVNTLQSLLREAVECGLSGDLFIHAPHWTLPRFLEDTQIVQVGQTFKLGGHTVVLDQGYTNEGPDEAPAAAADEAWLYISGPVEYATGPIQSLADMTEHVRLQLNTANAMAAQLGIYRFDPCCVKAARARICK